VDEVAERLRTSRASVYGMCNNGRLRHVRVGKGAIRVKASELDNLKAAAQVAPTPDPFAYVPTHLPVRRPRGGRRTASATKPA
jgi:excisionase family DNA binding protein